MPSNLKCKRYLEAEGRRCGHPRAERRYVVRQRKLGDFDVTGKPKTGQKQYVGAFCFPCWIEVMPTLPLELFLGWSPKPGSMAYSRAMEALHKQVDVLRKMWQEEMQKHEARLRNAG